MLSFEINAFHEKLIKEFAQVRIARGFKRGKGDSSPVLCREYLSYLELNKCKYVTQSNIGHYRSFCDHLKTRPKNRGRGTLSHTHMQHIRYAIHSLYEFMLEVGYINASPVLGSLFYHVEPQEKKIVSKKDVDAMFSHAQTPQEKALLVLVYGCGMRKSEIERLAVVDYKPNSSLILVREGKYYKSRVVPVSTKMNAILSNYLNEFRLKQSSESPTLLVNINGYSISGDECYLMIRRLSRKAGIKAPIGLHILRNSIAVHMLNRGADIEFVKRFLGHSLLDTTTLYATRRRKRISFKKRIYATKQIA